MTPPPKPSRALVVCAGTGRNAAENADARPALRLAKWEALAPLSEVYVVYIASEPNSRAIAEALAQDLGRGRRGGPKTRVIGLRDVPPGAAHDRRALADAVAGFVEQLADRELGARFAACEFIVSAATGTPALWTSLIDALDACGAALSVAWEREGDALAWWSCPAAVRSIEPTLRLLERDPVVWNVLITGPTGAGKSESARRLHGAWARHLGRSGRFVALNTAALPAELAASELFGHVKNAFTGAAAARAGAFADADGGTLFLDEIGDLPLALQTQLLTALDGDLAKRQRVIRPVGESATRSVDVRVIAGTNRDLHAMARDGAFRLDLLGRLSTHHLVLPSLADARHRIAGAYVSQLASLAEAYKVERFAFHGVARRRLLDFVFAPESAWRWNHRDVMQSAERLAMRARADAPKGGSVTVQPGHVAAEIDELRSRWRTLDGAAAAPEDDWADVRAAVRPDAWDALSVVQRWELRFLLRARAETSSQADAWRWLAARNLVEGARESPKNPSNAFAKRWERYRPALRAGR